nr:hypothetical protein SHINE37_43480 [Rhizobiaceae bacterium]
MTEPIRGAFHAHADPSPSDQRPHTRPASCPCHQGHRQAAGLGPPTQPARPPERLPCPAHPARGACPLPRAQHHSPAGSLTGDTAPADAMPKPRRSRRDPVERYEALPGLPSSNGPDIRSGAGRKRVAPPNRYVQY